MEPDSNNIQQRFESLPKNVQEHILSPVFSDAIKKVCTALKVSEETQPLVENELMMVVLFITPQEDLEKNLIEHALLKPDMALNVALALDSTVISPLIALLPGEDPETIEKKKQLAELATKFEQKAQPESLLETNKKYQATPSSDLSHIPVARPLSSARLSVVPPTTAPPTASTSPSPPQPRMTQTSYTQTPPPAQSLPQPIPSVNPQPTPPPQTSPQAPQTLQSQQPRNPYTQTPPPNTQPPPTSVPNKLSAPPMRNPIPESVPRPTIPPQTPIAKRVIPPKPVPPPIPQLGEDIKQIQGYGAFREKYPPSVNTGKHDDTTIIGSTQESLLQPRQNMNRSIPPPDMRQ